jgi:hypothetical protein
VQGFPSSQAFGPASANASAPESTAPASSAEVQLPLPSHVPPAPHALPAVRSTYAQAPPAKSIDPGFAQALATGHAAVDTATYDSPPSTVPPAGTQLLSPSHTPVGQVVPAGAGR